MSGVSREKSLLPIPFAAPLLTLRANNARDDTRMSTLVPKTMLKSFHLKSHNIQFRPLAQKEEPTLLTCLKV